MTTILEHDHEGFSECDLKKRGIDLYTRDPSTEVLMTSYRIYESKDDLTTPIKLWDKANGEPYPVEILEALADPHVEKWAFNAAFERLTAKRVLGVDTPYEGWRCGMVLAYMHSFTGGLDSVGEQMMMSLDEQKGKDGKRLINKFCMPQKITKANPHVRRDWNTDPEDWDLFGTYCVGDTRAEGGIKRRLLNYPLLQSEWELYELDQRINDRGLPIDRVFVESAIRLADQRKAELIQMMRKLTGLTNPNSPTQLLEWLRNEGYDQTDLQKDTIKKALKQAKDLENGVFGPPITKAGVQGLKLRQQSARLSVRKYNAILQRVGPDDRIRHVFQMGGASRTIRWAGRGFQPQNLTSTPKQFEIEDGVDDTLRIASDIIRDGDMDGLKLMIEEPMDALAGCVRSSVRVQPGKKLVVTDITSVESVVIGQLCGCTRLLNIFRQGKDAYKDFATEFYHVRYEDVTPAQRKVCKAPTLGCGFGLGGGDLRLGKRTGLWGYAEKMGIDMTRDEAHKAVVLWRDTYEEIPVFWYGIEKTIIKVVKDGHARKYGPITVKLVKPYLLLELPSGGHMFYYKPKIATERRTSRWGNEYTKEIFTHMGQEQKTRRWIRMASRGAKIVENLVQRIARDILKTWMLRAVEAGWNIIGHVHDELINEEDENSNYFIPENLIAELRDRPIEWWPDIPLNAAGWQGEFYKKD